VIDRAGALATLPTESVVGFVGFEAPKRRKRLVVVVTAQKNRDVDPSTSRKCIARRREQRYQTLIV
jgi:hypothetical protein